VPYRASGFDARVRVLGVPGASREIIEQAWWPLGGECSICLTDPFQVFAERGFRNRRRRIPRGISALNGLSMKWLP